MGEVEESEQLFCFSGLHATSSQRETYEIKTKPKLQKLHFIFFSRRFFEASTFHFQKRPAEGGLG